jgi:hypothetical protein
VRVWRIEQQRKAHLVLAADRPKLHAVQAAAERADTVEASERAQDYIPQRAAS